MSAAVSHARVDLVRSLLARALDPAADIGESKNAADKMVVVARREGVDFPTFEKSLLPVVKPTVVPAEPAPIPAAAMAIMPFGKFVGMMIIDIARDDVAYVAWMATKMDAYPDLQEAARITLQYLRGGK